MWVFMYTCECGGLRTASGVIALVPEVTKKAEPSSGIISTCHHTSPGGMGLGCCGDHTQVLGLARQTL